MDLIKLRILNGTAVAEKLSKLGSRIVPNVQKSTKEAVLYVHQEMPSYPPQPAGSSYRRTGTAGRSITTYGVMPIAGGAQSLSEAKPLADGAIGTVGGAIDYLPYLIDEEKQTQVHKQNGWFVLQKVVRDLKDGIKNIYKKNIKELLHG